MEEHKKMLQNPNPGRGNGRPGTKGAKISPNRGTKVIGRKNPRKRPNQVAKKPTADSNKKKRMQKSLQTH